MSDVFDVADRVMDVIVAEAKGDQAVAVSALILATLVMAGDEGYVARVGIQRIAESVAPVRAAVQWEVTRSR